MKKLLCIMVIALFILSGCSNTGKVEQENVSNNETNAQEQITESTQSEQEKIAEPAQIENGQVTDKEVTLTVGYYDDNKTPVRIEKDGTYTGNITNGLPDGNGIFTTVNSEGYQYFYDGDFVNGKITGKGIMEWVDSGYYEDGTYEDGLYIPTLSEMISSFGGSIGSFGYFDISKAAADFIDQNTSVFPTSDETKAESLCDSEMEVRKLKKSITGFDEKLLCLHDVYVAQTFEDFYGGFTVTSLLVSDSNGNMIIVYYPDSLDYYQGDSISTIYCLPLANTSFENVSGGTTLCLAALGSYIG